MAGKSFRILLVDDNLQDVTTIKRYFQEIDSSWGVDITHLEKPSRVIQKLSHNSFDILMTEYDFEDLTGFDLVKEVNDLGWEKPIIMLTDNGSEKVAARALRHGVTDYRIKGRLDSRTLRSSIERTLKQYLKSSRKQKRTKELKKEIGKDDVTGLENRRKLRTKIQGFINDCKNNNNELCLFMLALKNFDQINAIHGQETGDQILEQLGAFISSNARDGDTAGRYQGVEFCIAMPRTEKTKGALLAKRFINLFESKLSELEDQYNISINYGGTVVERKAGETTWTNS
ncbi:MAG: GGDEF domain-containing protein [bacterium]